VDSIQVPSGGDGCEARVLPRSRAPSLLSRGSIRSEMSRSSELLAVSSSAERVPICTLNGSAADSPCTTGAWVESDSYRAVGSLALKRREEAESRG
jgi:hypothetical protein